MATLISPGVNVSVIDESFFVSSGPGTVPLVIIATKENKTDPSGSEIAEGTLKENAGKLFTITSQRELLQTFGTPNFLSIGGTAQHGDALNEYGLLAAHSFLGISNRAQVLRADVDLGQLEPSDVEPVSSVQGGTSWLDLSETRIGLSQWNSTTMAFETREVKFLEDYSQITGTFEPVASYPGALGSYVMVAGDADQLNDAARFENRIYRRDVSGWVLLDSAAISEKVLFRSHTRVPQPDEVLEVALSAPGAGYVVGEIITLVGVDTNGVGAKVRVLSVSGGAITGFELIAGGTGYTDTSLVQFSTTGAGTGAAFTGTYLLNGDYWIKTTSPANGTVFSIKEFDAASSNFIDKSAPLADTRDNALLAYGNDPQAGDLFVHYDYENESFAVTNSIAEFSIMTHNGRGTVEARGTVQAPTLTAGHQLIINGVIVTVPVAATVQSLASAITVAGITNIEASVTSDQKILITNTAGKDITLVNATGNPIADLGLETKLAITNGYVHSNWSQLQYIASATQPTAEPVAGTLWYSTEIKVDILVNNGLGQWDELSGQLFIQPSQPVGPAVGDLWVDTDQVEEYPVISRWSGTAWIEIDNTDQSTPDGIVFRDARPSPDFGSDLGLNNGGLAGFPDLDADAPDPLLYPKGMLLWNSRYSTLNVKEWVPDYTFNGILVGDRWVTRSGNRADGSPYMGRFAVKQVIVQAMAAAIVSNDDIRGENVFFNLIAAPGFPELIDEMVSLNVDKKQIAFVVGDTPFRLNPSGTSLQRWATNANGAVSNGEEGLLTADTYLGVYYPSGLTTNLDGQEVVVPASHMVLRTMAFNDQVAYQWFAPAGFQRGVVTNAVNVGYVDGEGEFVPVELNEGQRDVLYSNNINPISFRPNRGLVVFGQKTRHPLTSALDRINVARLINFIRYQAPLLAEPFLFEPNDDITRRAVSVAFERFLEELVVLRGLFDFAVIVDESNNTPTRIDRNELWIDILIQPAKAIEFIFIPVRIRNTGSDLSL